VGFVVNGVNQTTLHNVTELNHPRAQLLSSKITVSNEQFSLFNIYDTDLATALAANGGPGKLLAWNVASWTRTIIPNVKE